MTNKDLLEEIRAGVSTVVYRALTTRITMILPKGTTLLKFSEQLAEAITLKMKDKILARCEQEIEQRVRGEERERIINYMENVLQGNPMISLAEMVGLIKASKPVEGVKHG